MTTHAVFLVLRRLEQGRIHYHLGSYQPDVITIHATLVGLRVEIDVSSDGGIDISCFEGDEGYSCSTMEGLEELIQKFGDAV